MLLFSLEKGDAMGAKIICTVLCLVVSGCATKPESNPRSLVEEKYAISYCLAEAYPDSEVSRDARHVAGAYLQKGKSGIDVYEQVRAFVDEYRKEPYVSKYDRNLNIMQCLDLFGSEELAHTVRNGANNANQGDH